MYNINIVCNFAMKTNNTMTFDKILDDGRLWAVRYDNEQDISYYRRCNKIDGNNVRATSYLS